jgi:hypothetical protein
MVENWSEEVAGEYLATIPSEWVADTVQASETGYTNSLTCYLRLARLAKLVAEGMEQIKDSAINEAQKYPKTFQFEGAEIQNKSGASRFDFKSVPEVQDVTNKLAAIQEKYKAAFLAAEKGLATVTDDGDQVDVSAVKFTPGRDTIAIKFIS